MIRFLREKSHVIGWVIVVTFLGTMFAGSLFLWSNKLKNKKLDPKEVIATAGEIQVDKSTFNQAFQKLLAQLNQQKKNLNLTPELQEILYFNTFNQVLQTSFLLDGAKREKVKISSQELDQAIDLICQQNNLKDKAALKKRLKELKIDFSDMQNTLKEELLVQKFVLNLQSLVTVNQQDVLNKYTELELSHIFIPIHSDDISTEKELKAQKIYADLVKNPSQFSEFAKQYSQDLATKDKGGYLGFVSYGTTIRDFEDVAYSLAPGSISKLFKTSLGFHILYLHSKRDKPKPLFLAQEKDILLKERKNQAASYYVTKQMMGRRLVIQDPILLAYQSKLEGNYKMAIDAYQKQISQMPYIPAPHYQLSKLYGKMGDSVKSVEELKKAELKAELNTQYDFPGLHLELARLYGHEKNTNKTHKHMLKAYELSIGNEVALKEVLKISQQLGLSDVSLKAQKELTVLNAASSKKNNVSTPNQKS